MSLPCAFHCQCQSLNVRKGGSVYKRRLKAKQPHVEDMLAKALPVLQTVLDNPGRVSVEWPRRTLFWNLPLWQKFEQRNGLKRVYFDGCLLGVVGKHYPIRKPWCVSTSSLQLIQHLPQHQCNHSHIHTNLLRAPQRSRQDIIPSKWSRCIVKPCAPHSSSNTTLRSLLCAV